MQILAMVLISIRVFCDW